jgi:hypothetical protein
MTVNYAGVDHQAGVVDGVLQVGGPDQRVHAEDVFLLAQLAVGRAAQRGLQVDQLHLGQR